MKKLTWMMLLICNVVCFSACSDDDDDNGSNGSNLPKPEMKYKQVAKVITRDGTDTYEDIFTYDGQGRISTWKSNSNNGTWTFQYTTEKIVITTSDGTQTYDLDQNGRTTKLTVVDDTEESPVVTEYFYSDGRIQKTVEDEDIENYTWDGGVLSKCSWRGDDKNYDETVMEYGNTAYVNNANIDLIYFVGIFWNNMEDASLLGLVGERCWYLPIRSTEKDAEDGDLDVYNTTYTYEQKDGYITKITVKGNDEEEPTIYEIIYND